MHFAENLTPASLSAVRCALRDALGQDGMPVPMGHAAEAVARAAGFASHAAVLAALLKSGPFPAAFSPRAFVARMSVLSSLPLRRAAEAVRDALPGLSREGVLAEEDRRATGSLSPVDLSLEGRMISASKSAYLDHHPGNFVIFNAVLATRTQRAFWHGDLDLTRDAGHLCEIASGLGEDVHVVREFDAYEARGGEPPFAKAIAVATASVVRDLRPGR